MNKQTKLWLGVAVVGIGGYLLWQKSQTPKKSFAAGPAPCKRGKCPSGLSCVGAWPGVCVGSPITVTPFK
jgi:hypothetical protein